MWENLYVLMRDIAETTFKTETSKHHCIQQKVHAFILLLVLYIVLWRGLWGLPGSVLWYSSNCENLKVSFKLCLFLCTLISHYLFTNLVSFFNSIISQEGEPCGLQYIKFIVSYLIPSHKPKERDGGALGYRSSLV